MRDLYRYKSLTPSSAQYGTKQLKVRQEFSDFSMAAAPLSKCIMRRLQVGGGKSIDKARKYLLAGCSIFAHQSHVGKSPKCLSRYDYLRFFYQFSTFEIKCYVIILKDFIDIFVNNQILVLEVDL